MSVTYDKRANMIDGIPSTFNVLFVVRSAKKCELCDKLIRKEDISKKLILYTDQFEFVHKPCLAKKGITYQHMREDDLSSPVTLMTATGKPYGIKAKTEKLVKQNTDEHTEHRRG